MQIRTRFTIRRESREGKPITALIVILIILTILEAAMIYALNSLGVSGFARIVLIAALPVIVTLGFFISKIGNR